MFRVREKKPTIGGGSMDFTLGQYVMSLAEILNITSDDKEHTFALHEGDLVHGHSGGEGIPGFIRINKAQILLNTTK